jgi:hypothetical protein
MWHEIRKFVIDGNVKVREDFLDYLPQFVDLSTFDMNVPWYAIALALKAIQLSDLGLKWPHSLGNHLNGRC